MTVGPHHERLLDERRRTQTATRRRQLEWVVMAWIVLVVSGVLEAVWATALGKADGFSRPAPSVVFAVGVVLSMIGLAFAMRTLPTGTAYAVWVGIGAVLTVAYAMATGDEPITALRVILLLAIVGCVIGLKVLD